MQRIYKAAALIYAWDSPLLTFLYPGFCCGSHGLDVIILGTAIVEEALGVREINTHVGKESGFRETKRKDGGFVLKPIWDSFGF